MELEPLVLPIESDNRDYNAGMDQAERRLDSIANKAISIGTKMSLGLTAPMSFFAKNAVSSFSAFDDAMTKSTSIISGMTEESRQAMVDQAKVIASTTTTSAAKAAEAYYFLASAGMDATTAIGALPVVEKFATAGAFDMAKATELLADSQAALGLATGDVTDRMAQMTRVSDVLVDAGNMSNASVEQFAKALTTKSAAALRGMNKDVEEGVAVLGVFADAGIKGEMAGEKLAIVLRETQNAVLKHGDAWAANNMSLYDAQGNMKNLADVVAMLEDATKGMSDQQKIATFDMLGFRSESMDAMKPLLGMSDKIRDYEKRLRSAGGATQDVADKQMKSFANQMAILKNQIELASIEIGEALAPSIMNLNKNIADGLNYWRSLSAETKTFTIQAGKMLAVMGPALVIFGKTAQTVNAIGPGMLKIGTYGITAAKAIGGMIATFAAANPIGMTILGIAAAVAAVTACIIGPEGMKSAWESAKTSVAGFFESAMGFMSNFSANFAILTAWIGENWRTILIDMAVGFATFNMNMVTDVGIALKTMMRVFVAFYGWLWETSNRFWAFIFSEEFANAVHNGAVAALEGIISFGKRSYEAMEAFAISTGQIFAALAKGAFDVFVAIPTAIYGVLAKTGQMFKIAMEQILSGNLPDIQAFMKGVADAAKQEFEKATEATVLAIDAAATVIEDKFAGVTEQATADFNKGMSDPNFFNTAKDILAEGMAEMVTPLEGFQAKTMAPQFIMGAKDIADSAKESAAAIDTMGESLANSTNDGTKEVKAATKAVDNLKKKTKEKAKIDFGKPRDGVEAYTSEAVALWMDYQKTVSGLDIGTKPKKTDAAAAEQASMMMMAGMGGGLMGVTTGLMGTPMGGGPAAPPKVSSSGVSSSAPVDTMAGTKVEQLLGQIEKNTRTQIMIRQVGGT